MYTLSEQSMVTIWERGLHQHSVERALTMLEAALPDRSRAALLALSVGQRDAHLLAIHEHTFGPRFAGFVQCPRCREALECSFLASDMRVGTANTQDMASVHTLHIDGYELHVRLPNSTDLLALLSYRSVERARNLLVQHCIQQAQYGEETIAGTTLPDTMLDRLGQWMLECDPLAEIVFDLHCPACGHAWPALFDVGTFLWYEIRTHVKRLLSDVHVLAKTYGWSEHDILTMSAVRRAFYLEMVSA